MATDTSSNKGALSGTAAEVVADLKRLYGPLINSESVCEIAQLTRNGLRDALWARRTPLMAALASSKCRVGRRLMWPTGQVARLLAGEFPSDLQLGPQASTRPRTRRRREV